MLPRNHPDRIQVAFDDHRLVANAGLLLPATLALHLGLPQLVDRHLDLGRAPGRANPGDKMLTLVASALAGGDCIDDADALRAGGTAWVLGCVVKAPSTLGTFLRSFSWGHVRQLDRVSRELMARAWSAGTGPGDGPLTIDLDSTICETYGLAREGARHHGYTGQRGYHPLGTPPHPASTQALALGNPVQSRPGPTASHSTPSLTAAVCNRPANLTHQLPQRHPKLAPDRPVSVFCCVLSRGERLNTTTADRPLTQLSKIYRTIAPPRPLSPVPPPPPPRSVDSGLGNTLYRGLGGYSQTTPSPSRSFIYG